MRRVSCSYERRFNGQFLKKISGAGNVQRNRDILAPAAAIQRKERGSDPHFIFKLLNTLTIKWLQTTKLKETWSRF